MISKKLSLIFVASASLTAPMFAANQSTALTKAMISSVMACKNDQEINTEVKKFLENIVRLFVHKLKINSAQATQLRELIKLSKEWADVMPEYLTAEETYLKLKDKSYNELHAKWGNSNNWMAKANELAVKLEKTPEYAVYSKAYDKKSQCQQKINKLVSSLFDAQAISDPEVQKAFQVTAEDQKMIFVLLKHLLNIADSALAQK